jgi:hypothetical protein
MATQPTDPKPRPGPPLEGRPVGHDGPAGRDATGATSPDYVSRALLVWPGLDRARLASTRGDPQRIVRLVARRTALPPETILRMLGVRGARPVIGFPVEDA